MLVIDYTQNKEYTGGSFPKACRDSTALFVLCKSDDIPQLRHQFDLDESTIIDCMDIDENVRFTAFGGYDFMSLVFAEMKSDTLCFSEINLYSSRRYMILVMPEHDSEALHKLEEKMLGVARGFLQSGRESADILEYFNHLLFLFFDRLIAHFSDMLELIEDRLQDLSEEIMFHVEESHFEEAHKLRRTAYALKKILRASSYIGLQLLCNENDILIKKKMFLFRNLDTRFRKLFDFSESVYGLSTELLHTHDSKITQKTNDVVNKLTSVTLFFGPLTVITGIYGMNFRFMPELKSPWGYPLSLLCMLGISIGIFIFMKKKKWL